MKMRVAFYLLVVGTVLLSSSGLGFLGGSESGLTSRETGAFAAPIAASNGGNNGGNDNNGNDNNGNDNNGNDNNGNDNGGGAILGGPAGAAPSAVQCARAGSDTTFYSVDGRIALRVFPSMSRDITVKIALVADPTTVPATPGQRIDALIFQLSATDCAGASTMATLPAEVNLGVRYSDQDAAGLNEAKFVIARLDPADNQWKPVEKLATDPPANWVSSTIMNMGTYAVYQAP